MDLFLIGAEACGGVLPIARVIYKILMIFWIVIPIGLIVFATMDLGKAVISSDEKEVKAAQKRLISRFVYAALVFFVPVIVIALMNLVADSDTHGANTTSWNACWQAIKNS